MWAPLHLFARDRMKTRNLRIETLPGGNKSSEPHADDLTARPGWLGPFRLTKRERLLLPAALVEYLNCNVPAKAAPDRTRFIVDYGATAGEWVRNYDIAVLEPGHATGLAPVSVPGTILLGYLSLGEVHSGRDFFAQADAEGFVLAPNPNWPDARFIDMRDRRWHARVVEHMAPSILAKGFNGLFLDTLDDAEFLERKEPARYAGMIDGAATLLRALRRAFPNVPLMVNRGYAVLPRAVGAFDMLLGESVLTTFDAGSGGYRPMTDSDYNWQLEKLREAKRRDPRVRLFSLDYWNPNDRAGIARIYAAERAHGLIPYVGTPNLTRIVPEP